MKSEAAAGRMTALVGLWGKYWDEGCDRLRWDMTGIWQQVDWIRDKFRCRG